MNKILVINALLKEKNRIDFEKILDKYLKNEHNNIEYLYVKKINNMILNLNKYTHLIISGSAASVLDNNIWDKSLSKIVMSFINNKKPVLGICYGHQFIAKTLNGIESIGKSLNPEVGFTKVNIKPNEIFDGIKNPVFSVAHFDEVKFLSNEFNIIADSKNTKIQAYQYRNLPVWGIQFHPEYGIEDTNINIKDLRKINEKVNIENDLEYINKIEQNMLIFNNFIKSSDIICIRPHHILCFQTYIGKGYSKDFVDNMNKIVGSLRKNSEQLVRLVKGTEHICNKCPNNIDGVHCESDDLVNKMDKLVLDYLGIDYGIFKYSELLKMKYELCINE